MFEPGSTSKVITIAGALEDGVVTPDTELSVPDHVQIWDRKLADDEDHPTISMSVREIISQSSNVGTIKVAMALNASRLDEWLRRFGYGTKTGIELPSESRGIYADRKDWSGVSVASFAIGQGVAVTPLQMLRVYGVIANGGMLVEPRIVAGTEGPDGFEPEERPAPVRAVSGQTAASMRGMLTGVVSEGTGAKAAVDGYKVGGKTGTAQAQGRRQWLLPGQARGELHRHGARRRPASGRHGRPRRTGPGLRRSDRCAYLLAHRAVRDAGPAGAAEPAAAADQGTAALQGRIVRDGDLQAADPAADRQAQRRS